MDGVNIYIAFSLLTRCIALLVIVGYIIPLQIREVSRPNDYLTLLRWWFLLLFVFSVVSSVPALAYQFLRLNGTESEALRNFASVSSSLSNLAISALLILIYRYKDKR